MVCPSGDAKSEAKLIDESALHSDVAGGVHASHANCVSSQTDNAARATSKASKVLKGAELDEAKRLIEAHVAVPANMQHAVDYWLTMSPEQREDAYEMHGIGCAGHTDNLITEDSHKQTEAKVVTANMVDDRASRVIQRFFFYGYRRRINFLKIPCICPAGQGPPIPATMELKALNFGHHGPMYWGRVHPKVRLLILKGYVGNKPAFHAGSCRGDWQGKHLLPAGRHLNGGELPAVGDVLWKVSKLLATDGLHHAYHLNEHRTFNIFAKAHHMKTCRLLSVKGSRQNLTVQQATRVLRNLPVYLQYLHETRIESVPNKLVEGVLDGLRDHYVLAALRARSVVDVAFTTPLIFFTHSDYVSKHQG
jgi:hypothetical protein